MTKVDKMIDKNVPVGSAMVKELEMIKWLKRSYVGESIGIYLLG